MSTDDLVARLGASVRRPPPRMGRLLGLAVLVGLGAAFAAAMVLWGPRPDLADATRQMRFWAKSAYAAALAVAGLLALERLGRPGERAPVGMGLAGLAVLAVLALAARELISLPPDSWRPMAMGHSWRVCSARIALISLPGFAATLWALRGMAPTRPRLAGAAAGLMTGGLGAFAYAIACNETALTFLASWYTLGIAAWTIVGALLGPRVLRW